MTAGRKRKSSQMSATSEQAAQKSAAEFFSEHQQIAGFDNPGKSLFTTIRELVENSLDAAEAIHVLPVVKVSVKEYSEEDHNSRYGIKKKVSTTPVTTFENDAAESQNMSQVSNLDLASMSQNESAVGRSKKTRKSAGESKEMMYYEICVEDNGCGIKEHDISQLLGKVLSGSKHGVRQTRGKFGLGSKMALIWSKKSSGLPIKIRTAHCASSDGNPSKVTEMVLDIDIQKNEPNIVSCKHFSNDDQWRGVAFSITIGGNWSSYRSRVLQYFQQLAVITPYAHFSLSFQSAKDPKKDFTAEFVHRSDQMPPIAGVILPHPKSVNNITLSRLISESKSKTLSHFLEHDMSSLSAKLVKEIIDGLSIGDCDLNDLTSSHIAALCQVLRDNESIKPPSSNCLSPAGEYNMRLGVLKELKPRLVSTYTDKPGSHEGHPFLVEAAISLGGDSVKEGINIFRFANRIPMLFETGADVVTQVATKRIKWGSYLIDPKKDAVGVYVSVVSTRIPFKGTSKEYIGDDVLEIQQSVRRALIGCCQQMKGHLAESMAKRNIFEKKKALLKYIPDVSRSLIGVMQQVKQRGDAKGPTLDVLKDLDNLATSLGGNDPQKKSNRKEESQLYPPDILSKKLTSAVSKLSNEGEFGGDRDDNGPNNKTAGGKKSSKNTKLQDFFLLVNSSGVRDSNVLCGVSNDSCHGSSNFVDLSQDFSLFSQGSVSSSASKGQWIDIRGGVEGKVWVPSRGEFPQAYDIACE